MKLKFNPLTSKFDFVSSKATEISIADAGAYYTGANTELALQEVGATLATITSPLLFKGSISVAGDFPTLALVQTGWFYTIAAGVTDNDVTKTNTGQVFIQYDEIAWNGSSWTLVGGAGFLKLDQTTPQTTVGTFTFPAVNIGDAPPGGTSQYLTVVKDENAIVNEYIGNNNAGTSAASLLYLGMSDGNKRMAVGYSNTNFTLGAGAELVLPLMAIVTSNPDSTGGMLFANQNASGEFVWANGGYATSNKTMGFDSESES
jgi:hypothetical protein